MPPPVFELPRWRKALTFSERLDSLAELKKPPPTSARIATRAQRRVRGWETRFPFLGTEFFDDLAAIHGVEQNDLLQVMGESSDLLAKRRRDTPEWLQHQNGMTLDSATNGYKVGNGIRNPELVGFLNLVGPFIEAAQQRLEVGLQRSIAQHGSVPLEQHTMVEIARSALPELLIPMLSRTLVLELNVRRLHGSLEGDDSHARFQSFCRILAEPDAARTILNEYPVLTRQVSERLHSWVELTLEFVDRFCHDWNELRTVFSTADPGTLTNIHWHKGDLHRHGRHVMIIEFSSGLRLVYKPKALAVDVRFQELLVWLNDRGKHSPLPTLKIVDRGAYGWVEFIPFTGCTSTEEVARFYERQGAYLAILHSLDATDFHLANIIANGEYPYLVDLETLFHPRLGPNVAGVDPAGERLRSSALRVGILPFPSFYDDLQDGVDLSGLGGVAGQKLPFAFPVWGQAGTDNMRLKEEHLKTTGSENRPTLNTRDVHILDFADDFVNGFAEMYRVLYKHRNDLLAADGPLTRFANVETRVVLRPTATYSTLRQASYHPDFLRDALDHEVFLGYLWLTAKRNRQPVAVLRAELDDLRNGDIPIFFTRPASADLWTSSGRRIPDYFADTSLSCIRRRLNEFSEVDLEKELWLVRASLAACAISEDLRHQSPRRNWNETKLTFDRDRLIAAAVDIGQRLERSVLRGEKSGVSWLTVRLIAKQCCSIAPAGFSLYDGLPGIALFLSYLGSVIKNAVFTDLGRGALQTIRTQLLGDPLYGLSIGAFDGLGGIIYVLTHLGTLWGDDQLLTEAAELTERLSGKTTSDRALDIIGGSAGCLASILALHRVVPSARTLEIAVTLGDHLVQQARALPVGNAWLNHIPSYAPLTGFSHGACGIGWALLELAEASGQRRFRDVAARAVQYEKSCFSTTHQNWPDYRKLEMSRDSSNGGQRFVTAWCHGAAGITLARLRTLKYLDNTEIRRDIDAGLATILRDGFGRSDTLCHGDWGNLEVLLVATEVLKDPALQVEVQNRAATMLENGNTNGWLTDMPLGVELPGLMTGLSGIGFGLLRTAYPERIPSVLLLDPPSLSSQTC